MRAQIAGLIDAVPNKDAGFSRADPQRLYLPPIGGLSYLLTLPGHGFYWFLLSEQSAAPAWH